MTHHDTERINISLESGSFFEFAGMNSTFHERLQFKMASGMDAAGVFTLNHSTGLLTTTASLDREAKEKYLMTGEQQFSRVCSFSLLI